MADQKDWKNAQVGGTPNANATTGTNSNEVINSVLSAAQDAINNGAQQQQQQKPQQKPQQPTDNNDPFNNYQQHCNNTNEPQMAKVPEFWNFLNSLENQAALTEEGAKYFDTLRKALEDTTSGSEYALKCHRLTEPKECDSYMFYSTKHMCGVIIVFVETMVASTENCDDAVVKMYGKARAAAINMVRVSKELDSSRFSILNVIGVTREDYCKVGAMITDIKNMIICFANPNISGMTSIDMSGLKVSLNPDNSRVRHFVNIISPHAVPDAMETGFTVDVVLPRANNQYFMTGPRPKIEYETRTIAAITAKIDFLSRNNTGIMGGMFDQAFQNNFFFLPIINITSIVSVMKTPDIIPLYLTLAYYAFISNGLWKQPFKNVGIKGAINIGNLVENNNTHQLVELVNDNDIEGFIAHFCKTPILSLAVTEGRSKIPGLEWFAAPDLVHFINTTFNNFYGKLTGKQDNTQQTPLFQGDPISQRIAEYVGTVTINGHLVDSRYVDYLHIVADNPNEAPNLRKLMNVSINPADKAKLVREICPDYSIKYLAVNCAIKYQALELMAREVSKNVRIQLDVHNQGINYIPLDTLLEQSKQYSNGLSGMSYGFGGNMNPGYQFSNYFGFNANNNNNFGGFNCF